MKINNSKGQVILFVIVSMTLAMAIGVTIATRTLSSLSRTSRSDTSNKALAAAEAGAERFLSMEFEELSTYNDADEPEVLTFEDAASGVATKATVTVESFTSNSATGSNYEFNLGTDYVKEITFRDSNFSGNIQFCWANNQTAMLYVVYTADGITEKGLVIPSSDFDLDTSNASVADGGKSDFTAGCKSVSISSDTYGLRLRALYNDTNVGIAASDLPVQGFKITSIGTLEQEGKVITSKKVTVFKSMPYMPAVFDTAIYTEEDFN